MVLSMGTWYCNISIIPSAKSNKLLGGIVAGGSGFGWNERKIGFWLMILERKLLTVYTTIYRIFKNLNELKASLLLS